MSRAINKAILVGNLGQDPEVRTTTNGTRVATFSLATSRQWTDAKGEKQEKTEWHRCVAWNGKKSGLADIIEKYVGKGDKVYVEGRIEYRSYEDKEKQTRHITEINVTEVLLLGGIGKQDKEPQVRGAKPTNDFEDFPEFDPGDDLPFR
jgi:single-strand DNA-binding protein